MKPRQVSGLWCGVLGGLFIVLLALLAGGWIFSTQRVRVEEDYHAVIAGETAVSVRHAPGTAIDAATRAAADYRADGWDEHPVSTATFKLFVRGRHTAALLAEDLPQGGAAIAEYRH